MDTKDEEHKRDLICPVCGTEVEPRQCKVFCPKCKTLIYNCSEF